MPGYLTSYFQAEQRESGLFIAIGVASIATAIVIWRRYARFRAAAYPLVAIALIQIGVGTSVYARTEDQVAALAEQRRADPAGFRAAEGARMAKVMANFQLYELIEVTILVAGVGLVVAGRKRASLVALGVGCIAQGGVMLVFDGYAEARGEAYQRAVAGE